MNTKMCLKFLLCMTVLFVSTDATTMLDITDANLEEVLNSHELVFVNFYADWCRFSRMLAPIFSQASDEVQKAFPAAGTVALGRVDCENNPSVALKYGVNKYPTMKLFRGGQMAKREFRGQRSVEAIVQFIREQLKDPVTEFKSEDEMDDFEADKRSVIGYFTSKEAAQYESFEKVAKNLKDDCNFYAAFGEVSRKERTTGDNVIFRPTGGDPDMVYLGSLTNHDLLKAWATDKCIPLVREITFKNGEELTEEGKPFLILFHKKEDTESLEAYQKEISRGLLDQKDKINFLEADCDTFSHPLHHLGKSPKECPLIAIDSFKHMYLFPNFADLTVPGKLRTFLNDLHSGKLHREFHHGPDAVTKEQQGGAAKQEAPVPSLTPEIKEHLRKQGQDPDAVEKQAQAEYRRQQAKVAAARGGIDEATTVESVFKNLMPSEHRYTIMDRVKDEL